MTVATFSLRRLGLKNYRSIGSCDLELGPLAIFVGQNGAGKSNILDSLRFIRQALEENISRAVSERGGIAGVRRRSAGSPTDFTISLEFSSGKFSGVYEVRIGTTDGGGIGVAREVCRISSSDPEGADGEDHFYELRNGRAVRSSENRLPRTAVDRLALVALSGLEEFRPVYDGLAGMEVFNPSPEAMRRPQAPTPGDPLRRDGSNIASVLERLRHSSPETERRVEEYLRAIVPGIRSVRSSAVSGWETLEFQQDVSGSVGPWSFPASAVSDGTLRALGVLVALFAGTGEALSPVGVEEPEIALHPAAAGVLLDAIRDASEHRQVLLTTHSPDLLDSSTILPGELFAVRSVGGTTEVGHPDAAVRFAFDESLFTAGELLRADQFQPEPEEAVSR